MRTAQQFAVSYTHLDVYKRQLQNGVSLLAVSEFCEAKQLRDGGIDAQIILLSPMCDLNEAQEAVRLGIICAVGSEAVSYTHLDVYKRQSFASILS